MSQRLLNERDSDTYHVTVSVTRLTLAALRQLRRAQRCQHSTSVTILGPSSSKGTS